MSQANGDPLDTEAAFRVGRPLARSKELVVSEMGDEVLVYDLTRHKAHLLNSTAARIWRLCDGQRTMAKIADLVGEELAPAVSEEVLALAMHLLSAAHLLDGRPVLPSGGVRYTRRAILRKAGLVAGAVMLLPVVSSLVVPTAAQAGASCLPIGASCTMSTDCCSGTCETTCIGGGVVP